MSSGGSAPQTDGLSRIPFTIEAEKQIKALSFWLAILGWLGIVAGIFDVVNIVISRNFAHIFNAVLHIVLGLWCLQAAEAFKKVATTDVADQAFLVAGFSKLRNIFWLQGIMIVIGLAFVAAVFLFLLLHGINVQ